MKAPILPSRGGSYTRSKNGKLTRKEGPVDPAPAEVVAQPAEETSEKEA
ncbi:hypothetical protein LCGC14_0638600 [marine sediment metagenome]|uniref:Uncharacterized protein n=1 Tax=marine sediment metagenome TaxID=412755 RepID=A0A0F9U895_9ZZZZ